MNRIAAAVLCLSLIAIVSPGRVAAQEDIKLDSFVDAQEDIKLTDAQEESRMKAAFSEMTTLAEMTGPELASKVKPASNGKQITDWNSWNQALDRAVRERFSALCPDGSFLVFKRSPPCSAAVSYTVTADRRVTDVLLDRESDNCVLNFAIKKVVESLDRDPILQFPEGSKEREMRKTSTFSNTDNPLAGVVLAK